MKSTDRPRPAVSLDGFANPKLRYNKVPKGRKVTKAERPTYDRATAAMLAGLIHSWTVYEDGWVFVAPADCHTVGPLSLPEAGTYLDLLTTLRAA